VHLYEKSFFPLGPNLAFETVSFLFGPYEGTFVAFDYCKEFALVFLFSFPVLLVWHIDTLK
jgi:hypothetical protein